MSLVAACRASQSGDYSGLDVLLRSLESREAFRAFATSLWQNLDAPDMVLFQGLNLLCIASQRDPRLYSLLRGDVMDLVRAGVELKAPHACSQLARLLAQTVTAALHVTELYDFLTSVCTLPLATNGFAGLLLEEIGTCLIRCPDILNNEALGAAIYKLVETLVGVILSLGGNAPEASDMTILTGLIKALVTYVRWRALSTGVRTGLEEETFFFLTASKPLIEVVPLLTPQLIHRVFCLSRLDNCLLNEACISFLTAMSTVTFPSSCIQTVFSFLLIAKLLCLPTIDPHAEGLDTLILRAEAKAQSPEQEAIVIALVENVILANGTSSTLKTLSFHPDAHMLLSFMLQLFLTTLVHDPQQAFSYFDNIAIIFHDVYRCGTLGRRLGSASTCIDLIPIVSQYAASFIQTLFSDISVFNGPIETVVLAERQALQMAVRTETYSKASAPAYGRNIIIVAESFGENMLALLRLCDMGDTPYEVDHTLWSNLPTYECIASQSTIHATSVQVLVLSTFFYALREAGNLDPVFAVEMTTSLLTLLSQIIIRCLEQIASTICNACFEALDFSFYLSLLSQYYMSLTRDSEYSERYLDCCDSKTLERLCTTLDRFLMMDLQASTSMSIGMIIEDVIFTICSGPLSRTLLNPNCLSCCLSPLACISASRNMARFYYTLPDVICADHTQYLSVYVKNYSMCMQNLAKGALKAPGSLAILDSLPIVTTDDHQAIRDDFGGYSLLLAVALTHTDPGVVERILDLLFLKLSVLIADDTLFSIVGMLHILLCLGLFFGGRVPCRLEKLDKLKKIAEYVLERIPMLLSLSPDATGGMSRDEYIQKYVNNGALTEPPVLRVLCRADMILMALHRLLAAAQVMTLREGPEANQKTRNDVLTSVVSTLVALADHIPLLTDEAADIYARTISGILESTTCHITKIDTYVILANVSRVIATRVESGHYYIFLEQLLKTYNASLCEGASSLSVIPPIPEAIGDLFFHFLRNDIDISASDVSLVLRSYIGVTSAFAVDLRLQRISSLIEILGCCYVRYVQEIINACSDENLLAATTDMVRELEGELMEAVKTPAGIYSLETILRPALQKFLTTARSFLPTE
ncbi:hypothetical protein GMRT_11821 [Giardia muris]|uniref:Uncharacterized protein n=1 Tax=Giardia muris TaxID=5742 RepID=A0A4Z1SSV4_GIAMU|nr:hypothetical protein GMRT_11821 [Giardia muris]|eukprot:TNJ29006.1 hypothetical protein GMRT_11821 [Giardia muris]